MMVRLRKRSILTSALILILLTILFVQNAQFTQRSNKLNIVRDENSSRKFYFESELSHQLRLRVQDKVQFGSQIKKVAGEHFNTREGFNESSIDSIPIVRHDSPDMRDPKCKKITYPRSETKVSVVITFNNELLSLVLRSLYSILLAIPQHNFHEIILIDDGSNLTEYSDLQEIRAIIDSFTVNTRYLRFEENRGLIFSRLFGCKMATGEAILVLDSHVEVNPRFIEPLLAITDKNYSSIASPIINFWDNLGKHPLWSPLHSLCFDPYLNWVSCISPKGHLPFSAAAIFGGAYLATKRFMEEVDYFGKGMEGWGDENLEISLKAWMCGEGVVYVPCSQVIHFSAVRNAKFHGNRKRPKHYFHNAGLILKSYFSDKMFREVDLHHHHELSNDLEQYSDDIQTNREMLARNRCSRDYPWMRRHLMPKVESFDNETLVAHTLMVGGECVEVIENRQEEKVSNTLQLTGCGEPKSMKNLLRLTVWGELRMFDSKCLDWGWPQLLFDACHRAGGNQITKYGAEDNYIKSTDGFCLVQFKNTKVLGKGLCHPNTSNEVTNYIVPKFKFEVVFNERLFLNAIV